MATAASTPSPDRPEREPDRGGEDQREVYGPLDIERHVKDDGRLLILYARRERRGA